MISVIVPVYNVEKYLPRCLESILRQTYTDYELLLIDDDSTDSSGRLCDEFAALHPGVRVFHKPNGGVSDARNYGMQQAKGEFFTFIDSDDYPGPDYLRILAEQMDDSVDITALKSVLTYSEEYTLSPSEDRRQKLYGEDAFRELLLARLFGVSAYGKLYRRQLFEKEQFTKNMYAEDLYLIPYVIADARGVSFSSSVQYYYYQRADSAIHTLSQEKMDQWELGFRRLSEFTLRQYPGTYDAFLCRYVSFSFFNIINQLLPGKDYVRRAKAYRDLHRDWWKQSRSNPWLSRSKKLSRAAFLIHPLFYKLLYRLHSGMTKKQ